MISVKHLSKKFGDVTVLKDINLDIKEKEVVVIIGPSGSGKSTILRCLNHLETPSGGEIVIDGIKLEEGANLNAIRREVGMVFQRFNLFPNMKARYDAKKLVVTESVPKNNWAVLKCFRIK